MLSTIRRWRRSPDLPPPGLTLVAAVLLLACQPTPPADDAELRPSPQPAPESQVSATESDSLELSLEVPQQVRAGAATRMSIRVENTSGGPLDLYLRGREIAFDLIVENAHGEVVWRRLEEEVIQAVLRIETLQPGAMLELADSWDQRANDGDPVPPGTYTVRGEILTDGEPLVTPDAPLRIGSD